MGTIQETPEIQNVNALICFTDITGFSQVSKQFNSIELFQLLQDIATITANLITDASGTIVKYIGDSSLIIFPDEKTDTGVRALLKLKKKLENYFISKNLKNKVSFSLHYGEIAVGKLAPFDTIDVLGDAVRIAFTLSSRSYKSKFVMSPQVFRKLDSSTRKLFHKFTPPIEAV